MWRTMPQASSLHPVCVEEMRNSISPLDWDNSDEEFSKAANTQVSLKKNGLKVKW